MPNQMYLSTLSPDAPALAEECGLGMELDHFCTAANMDENFAEWDAAVRADMRHARRFVLHAPFAEIAPSAIDPLIREVSMKRLAQAIGLCRRYGVNRMVAIRAFCRGCIFRNGMCPRPRRFSASCWKRRTMISSC